MKTDFGIEVIQVGNIVDDTNIGFKNPQRGRIYSSDGLSPCICDGSGGGGREPKILEFSNFISLGDQNDSYNRVWKTDKYCGSINCTKQMGILEEWPINRSLRIRKLTPRECFRLMGVTETDIDKIQQSGVSQSQQYKMAGNSIVVDVLEHIFRKLLIDKGQESQQLLLF